MTHRGYQDSIRRLQQLNEELESFNYTVSHDLRTPVRTISGFTRMLLDHHRSEFDPESQDLLDRIMAATDQMEKLIEGLLTLSRLERQNLSNDPVNLSQAVQDILQDFHRLSPERKLQVHVEPNLKVKGDYPLLHTAISNLLANAWKFTGKKDQAHIEFGRTQIQGRPAYFVHDNGAGFDMRYAQSLFNPFQRFHSKDQFDGIGIGLATTRRIIERHGGQIWAEAKPNEGATFYFTLEKSATA
jgi:light-regulated signal transduction histidine kinase (bacteriophytochrome)